ncbi:TMAO reductase system periplasmic protein TorT [Aliiroseovarius lamellibrachiae]|uniref:TMAO reductase system periplasmic protein TorT n=1 Tax=Aliiroseovarius lamellibrachiae TaxID=1924933 RepID=UPI001BDF7EDD|nr:TMAO reductase system periplasmic protein TorT [Aliiroseovarius lamellibrachiae]MBT2132519.1 TMAO reductase system periplasmic protein TorT [Aliiroseovarius lamellibrachiae]
MARRYGELRPAAILTLICVLMGMSAPLPAVAQGKARASICVVVPHFKDEYWLSVGFGLQEQAAQSRVDLLFYESGGYLALSRQIPLLETCLSNGVDAILLGAVSADAPKMLAAVKAASQTVPVLALVNALRAPDLAASIGVDWREMGEAVGAYLASRHPKGTAPVQVGFITGPKDSGWSPLLEDGLRQALVESSAEIVTTRHADTGLREQLREVEAVLAEIPDLDYVIGSAPAIEGAMGLAAQNVGNSPKLIATYISHSVRRGLQSGKVLAVPFDDPVAQGRLGVLAALRAINGEISPTLIGPDIRLIDTDNPDKDHLPLAPAGLVLAIE